MSSLVGETIYIFADSDWVASPVFGELHVLDSQSDTLHYAGSTSQYRDISFWLLDPTDDYPTIEAAYRAGSTVTLVDWLGNSTSVKIRDLKITRHLTDIKRPNSNYEVAQCSARVMKQ